VGGGGRRGVGAAYAQTGVNECVGSSGWASVNVGRDAEARGEHLTRQRARGMARRPGSAHPSSVKADAEGRVGDVGNAADGGETRHKLRCNRKRKRIMHREEYA